MCSHTHIKHFFYPLWEQLNVSLPNHFMNWDDYLVIRSKEAVKNKSRISPCALSLSLLVCCNCLWNTIKNIFLTYLFLLPYLIQLISIFSSLPYSSSSSPWRNSIPFLTFLCWKREGNLVVWERFMLFSLSMWN